VACVLATSALGAFVVVLAPDWLNFEDEDDEEAFESGGA